MTETEKVLTAILGGGTLQWVIASAVATMPKPRPEERWYGWLYNFAQRVGANHTLVQKQDPPRDPSATGGPVV